MPGLVRVEPEMVLAAATELELLADRLQVAVSLNAPVTHVIPSGAEEVSGLAAGYFNRTAASFEPAALRGIAELHNAAAVLRNHVAQYIGHDVTNAGSLGSIEV
ncbi:PE family protein [Antrihabitans cavernicola]|uniref:PE family protein n=1 Tax=Antrihabitans cavernicola TaxID=2495913 RepID=A0A5A7SJT8_9NOCA|nr:PE family protein [Spelaeibacter cavernicola]KAA0024695.1 PE family protein [Spelaeibacter cavernicola]